MQTQIFFPKTACIAILAALVATVPMKADDSPSNTIVGCGLSMAGPKGELGRVSGSGLGLSLSFEWGLRPKHASRLRIELATFAKKKILPPLGA